MARLRVGGVDHEVRPFKFRELREAAPAIDRISAHARSGASGLAAMTDGLADLLEVLAIGLDGRSAEDLAAELAMTEVAGVHAAFVSLLAESGLKPVGESEPARAPANPVPDDLSAIRSTTSSPNWSAPAAAIGTG